ncbi:acyl-CoA dehydrogenase family protein [Allorhizobium pseudoryzae]|jgi:alkylation response protein AidB-like acyl-CoA dehydrogenase|uniref:acyl-CoA dehydrogenase family protein n=1 Tax=Allorhizobium pseudoryzae TaxID=379684 RepID=UPI003D011B89
MGATQAGEVIMRDLLTDDELMLQESVRRFMRAEVEPLVPRMQAEGEPPRSLLKRMGDLGFLGTCFDEAYGGSGASLATRAIVGEETARVDAGFDLVLFADIMLFARAIARHGTESQKRKYLVPVLTGDRIGAMGITEPGGGSDALGAVTRGRQQSGGWVVKGAKTFVTNAPTADFFLVITRTSDEASRIDGGTWFILDRGMEGLATGKPFSKMGMRSSPTGEIFLDDVRVGEDQVLGQAGRGFHMLMESLDVERVMVGASTIGIAQACLDEAAAYAHERRVFGKAIREYQLIQEKIADMATGIEMSRAMLYRLLRAVERGEKVTREAAILKYFSSRMLTEISAETVQIWGGAGQLEDNKTARLYRDGKHHEIGAGTNEIMKVLIAKETFKEMGYGRK